MERTFLHTILLFALLIGISCSSQEKENKRVKQAKAYYNHGTNELIAKNYTTALRNLIQAHNLDPENTDILNNLGMAYYYKKQNKEALTYFNKAIEIDPKFNRARINIATIMMNTKNYSEALRLFKIISKDLLFQEQYKTYYNMGKIYLIQQDTLKAKQAFEQSLENYDNFCPASFELGTLNYRLGKYKKAYRNFYKASQGTCFNQAKPHYYQALTLIKLNKIVQAYEKLEFIQERFPSNEFEQMIQRKLITLNTKLDEETLKQINLKKELRLKREKVLR